MRILQVIHQFPPHSSQGSEVYCRDLSLALQGFGDTVGVFHTSNTRPRFPRRLVRSVDAGLTTFHCIDGAEYARLADWPNRFLQDRFRDALREFRPDIVHFHNYISLGDHLVGIARETAAHVVYTLHDYGLICPNSLLLRSDGNACGKADGEFFQDCCPILPRTNAGRVPPVRRWLPSLARWRMFANQQPRAALRTLLATAVATAERWLGSPESCDVAGKRAFYLGASRRIFADVDLFLSPSQFLKDRYVACGVSPERIRHVRNGLRAFPRSPKTSSGQLRFGYIGALHPHKGIELLVRAFQGLHEQASLHVHGTAFGSPVSEAYARRVAESAGPGVHFHGAYDNAQIGKLLADIDVVVAPSVWYENSPLTIQEAFVAGVPVITADAGGMAELVRHDVDGLLFRFGDESSLQSAMRRLAEQPELIMQFAAQMPAVPSIERQAAVVRECYLGLHAGDV